MVKTLKTMKKKLTIFILLITNLSLAQNLVLNPSFEDTLFCPYGASAISVAFPWFQPSLQGSSSDLFNPCSFPATVGVPYNFTGFQFPRTGEGYAGIYCNVDSLNIREYIEGKLESPLLAGNIYCVSFYVSLADTAMFAISKIGAYLSQDSLLYSGYDAITFVTPQIENTANNFLTSKTDWMEVYGTFTANGGENFITIGNFNNPSNTPTLPVIGGVNVSGYYYIDDVSVINCDSLQSINKYNIKDKINVYPNPFSETLNIKIDNSLQYEFLLYDLGSRLCVNYTFTNSMKMYLEPLAKGMYFYELRSPNGNIEYGKVIKK